MVAKALAADSANRLSRNRSEEVTPPPRERGGTVTIIY
jgi:hypothetical protein